MPLLPIAERAGNAAGLLGTVGRHTVWVGQIIKIGRIEGFSWRQIDGHSVLSNHSFGIAVDINPSGNPSCGVTQPCRCYNDLITDMPLAFVQAFEEAGFVWGGDWQEHPDPIHFEWNGWQAPATPEP